MQTEREINEKSHTECGFFVLHILELLRLKNRSAFVACDDEVIYKMDLQGV